MALSSFKRQWSRALSLRDSSPPSTSAGDPETVTDAVPTQQQLPAFHRSSPKGSVYQHSPPHSGTTLHDPDHAPSHIHTEISNIAYPSDTMILTVGDSVITVETHRTDVEQNDRTTTQKRKKSFGLRRVKTAPTGLHGAITHGSITTIESTPAASRIRAWSYPQVNWDKLNLVRRVRGSVDRKEARKGKAASEPGSDPQSPADEHEMHIASQFQYPMMSGAAQDDSSYTKRPSDGAGISPRASGSAWIMPSSWAQSSGSPGKSLPRADSHGEEKRKDSHFYDAIVAKAKATIDLEAVTRELTSDKRPHRNSSILLHPIDWIRSRHNSGQCSSSDSSTSGSAPPSPTTRSARPARRRQETHTAQIPSFGWPSAEGPDTPMQTAHVLNAQAQSVCGKISEASTSTVDELLKESRPTYLPPGVQIPAPGQAGPSDWLDRGLEDHYRRSAELATRASHPMEPSRYLHAQRGEDKQRFNPMHKWQQDQHPAHRHNVHSFAVGMYAQAWDWALDNKGKGVAQSDFMEGRGGEVKRKKSSGGRGSCVTTLTLAECDFGKE
ncbi:hypothetical protein AUEXF2481DRAFT_29501 [Aureobasidium subglaciale EXF-2481]|uniref:Uncharacterized protein n=1 Tax=Aureobasidium subglaciale (strain EXF-2481) TaxID=1043005 RepID=A0A074YC94_AURSE|nr:uncharacterized protein AUEXF2481DRAFT_29501 [Aureobasidium subglaciale EXF-2481]KEQ95423.1 hypothetical protein AUEXF2481DRAFT_29501 [Aureobasidium subglaciale EXF-2481]